MKFPKAISVKALNKFNLKIHFNDGVEGIYDLSDLAGKGVFKTWDDDDHFFNFV